MDPTELFIFNLGIVFLLHKTIILLWIVDMLLLPLPTGNDGGGGINKFPAQFATDIIFVLSLLQFTEADKHSPLVLQYIFFLQGSLFSITM